MDLVSLLQNYLQGPSTALTTPNGTGVKAPGTSLVPSGPNIIDGEWSEVPKALGGPKLPATTAAGSLGGSGLMSTPLLAMIMSQIQPDIIRNGPVMDAARKAAAAAAVPSPQPQAPPQAPQATPNASQSQGAGAIPWWANATGADFSGGNTPMPRPRPPMAPQAPSINPNGSIMGAQGPTSVGGAPLVGQNAPMNIQSQSQQQDPSSQQNGSALIAKMLQYLHNNAQLSDNPNTAAGSTFN